MKMWFFDYVYAAKQEQVQDEQEQEELHEEVVDDWEIPDSQEKVPPVVMDVEENEEATTEAEDEKESDTPQDPVASDDQEKNADQVSNNFSLLLSKDVCSKYRNK